MPKFPIFSKSSKYKSRYPEVAFGLTHISGCQNPFNPPGFDQYKRKRLRKMRKRETLAQITQRIEIYNRFFESFGFECPLPKHLKRTVNSGFPRYNLMVDTHFMAEMCAGILVAVTDYDRFEGRGAAAGDKSGVEGNWEVTIGETSPPVSPSPGKAYRRRGGEIIIRGASPLLDTPPSRLE